MAAPDDHLEGRGSGTEVFPAIREIAKSLDLKSPFEANVPVHLKYSTDLKPGRAAAAE